MKITYTIGDATKPGGRGGQKVICHICNDIGAWGAGFVVALSRRWKEPEKQYKTWFSSHSTTVTETITAPFQLGSVQFVRVEEDITVANMIGQHGITRRGRGRGKAGEPPVRYDAVRNCLQRVAEKSLADGASIHMPRIGAGLAGGDWTIIEEIIQTELCARGLSVTVHDLPP